MDKNSAQYKKYEAYIASEVFKQIKVDLILIRGQKCEDCGKPAGCPTHLQLHHVTYDRLYNEESEDLRLLCARCHMIEHKLLKPKQKGKKRKLKGRGLPTNDFSRQHMPKLQQNPKGKKQKTFPERYPMNKRDKLLHARYEKFKASPFPG